MESPYPYIIYKITCLTNNKLYIGQTRQELKTRIVDYRREIIYIADKNRSIISAMRKHGFDAFKFEEIDRTESIEELDYMEKYWIAFYRATDRRYGYNLMKGGCHAAAYNASMRKAIRCIETGECFSSMAAAARAKGFSPAGLTLHMKGVNKTCDGHHWEWTGNSGAIIYETSSSVKIVFENTRKRQKTNNKGARCPVKCVETGETFESTTAAANKYGVDKRAIYSALERGISAAGLHWLRIKPKQRHNSNGKKTRAVIAIESGIEYPSLAQAAKIHGLNSSTIWCAIRDGWTAGGFHWEYIVERLESQPKPESMFPPKP